MELNCPFCNCGVRLSEIVLIIDDGETETVTKLKPSYSCDKCDYTISFGGTKYRKEYLKPLKKSLIDILMELVKL